MNYAPRIEALTSSLLTGDVILYRDDQIMPKDAPPPTLVTLLARFFGDIAPPLRSIIDAERPLWSADDDWNAVAIVVRPFDKPYVVSYVICEGQKTPMFALDEVDYHLAARAAHGRFAVRHLLSAHPEPSPTLYRTLHGNIHALCQRLNTPQTDADHQTSYDASSSPCFLALQVYIGMRIVGDGDSLPAESAADLFGDGGRIEAALRADFVLGVEVEGRVERQRAPVFTERA